MAGIKITDENFDKRASDKKREAIAKEIFAFFSSVNFFIYAEKLTIANICNMEDIKSIATSDPFARLNCEKTIRNRLMSATRLFQVFESSMYSKNKNRALKNMTDNLDQRAISSGLF